MGIRPHLHIGDAPPREVGRHESGRLADQFRADCHALRLQGRQYGVGIDPPAVPRCGVRHQEFDVTAFLGQHHAPGKQIAFLGPAHIARVQVVAQRYRQLNDGKEEQAAHGGPAPSRGAVWQQRIGAGGRARGNLSAKAAPPYARRQAARPIRLEEDGRSRSHNPGKQTNLRKQQPGAQMKEDDKGIGKPARRREGQPDGNGQVV